MKKMDKGCGQKGPKRRSSKAQTVGTLHIDASFHQYNVHTNINMKSRPASEEGGQETAG